MYAKNVAGPATLTPILKHDALLVPERAQENGVRATLIRFVFKRADMTKSSERNAPKNTGLRKENITCQKPRKEIGTSAKNC